MRFLLRRLVPVLIPGLLFAQQQSVLDNTDVVEHPKSTWETQKQARTFELDIPAPRGQITDRNGSPLAQTRLSYNLAISYPTPLDWDDQKILDFAHQQITLAHELLKRDISISDDKILNHYKNRGVLPLDIVGDLTPQEMDIVRGGLTPNLILRQTYVRFYPNGPLAGHILGYTGPEAPLSIRPIENNDFIFPESEGREGLEQFFDTELRGRPGQLHLTFDKDGKKTSERVADQPVPGYNVVTTLDEELQRECENILKAGNVKGAIVVIDPTNGEILAMASNPGFNPNEFVPTVPPDVYKRYNDDPSAPLLPRAYRSAYPPGSTFKVCVGLSALDSGKITPQTEFDCPATFDVGNVVFHNWKKYDAGRLNFVEALTQSCNTWFYQCGLKTGAKPIIEYARDMGYGSKTGIPLRSEAAGNIPDDDYMLRVQHRRILTGDLANMSIGQGDILISPLQMAQAMCLIATGGTLHQVRLVKQIQAIDNKVIAAYPDRIRDQVSMTPLILATLHKAMIAVTEDANGTAHKAQVPGLHVAGKTGTAQWGPHGKQRTAAWFTGFIPADNPQYAFAALFEGDPNDNNVHGGSSAAPLIGQLFREVYKKDSDDKKSSGKAQPAKAAAPGPDGEDTDTSN